MAEHSLRFAGLLLTSLLVGTMFGIWLGFEPSGLSSGAYVEQQQAMIRALNTIMPIAGAICIAITVTLAFLARRDRAARRLLVSAAACLIVAGLVTRFANQPINRDVMTWSVRQPPLDWTTLRDTWWQWHIVRTAAGVLALSLVLLEGLRRRVATPDP